MKVPEVPEDASRDFVAGCLVVKNGKLLLIDHDRYGVWLPPGGHVEKNETPDQTARRETLEEVGLKVEILGSSGMVEEDYFDLPRPLNVNLHRVEENHWHVDFLYPAEIVGEKEASHDHEHNGKKWFSREELEIQEYDIPEYIRQSGKKAISLSEG